MEFARKMILVPAGRSDPTFEKISQLDKEILAILKNKRLSNYEKMKAYSQTLARNMEIESRIINQTNTIVKPEKQDDLQENRLIE